MARMTAPPVPATRVCRFCSASIPAAARVCPECHKDITGRDISGPSAPMTAADESPREPLQVSVVDVNMPFASMVWFMVKWALAAIPAILMLSVLGFVIAMVFGLLVGLAR